MKKAQYFSFMLLIVMVASLIGCGPKATAQPTVVVEQPTAVVAQPTAVPTEVGVEGCRVPAPDKPITINIIGWSYPIINYYFDQLKKCSGVKNITVNAQLLDSGTATEQIRLAAAAGGQSTYDIILTSSDGGLTQELAEKGALVPMDDLIKKYDAQYNIKKDIVGWPGSTWNGQIWAIPLESNLELFFYRADLFEKYNLMAPDTWDDVIADCKVLQAEKSIDFPGTMTLYQGWAWANEFAYMLGSQGVPQLDPKTNMPLFNGPEGVKSVEKILEVAKACMGDKGQGLTYSIDNTETAMENGSIALAFVWASRAAAMDNPDKSKFVGKINFSPSPRFAPGAPYGSFGAGASLSIMKSKNDPELLFRIILEATSYDSQVQAAKFGIPSRTSVGEVATARYLAAAAKTLAGNVPNDWNPANGLAQTALGNWLPLATEGKYTIQELLDKAATEYLDQAKAAGYIK